MDSVLSDVRSKGFATRDTSFLPASNTLAVPVFDQHGVACSIGLTYFSSTMKPAQVVERHLPELQAVARDIGERLKTLQSDAAPPTFKPPPRNRRRQGLTAVRRSAVPLQQGGPLRESA
jgi:hypothetical protein